MNATERAELRALCERATGAPWAIWEGPQYVGGAADLCIGAGEEWLANMDHRRTRCQQIGADGHFEESCDICTIDSGRITDEQRANAELIAAARTALPRLLDRLDELEREIGGTTPTDIRVLRQGNAQLAHENMLLREYYEASEAWCAMWDGDRLADDVEEGEDRAAADRLTVARAALDAPAAPPETEVTT